MSELIWNRKNNVLISKLNSEIHLNICFDERDEQVVYLMISLSTDLFWDAEEIRPSYPRFGDKIIQDIVSSAEKFYRKDEILSLFDFLDFR